MSSPYHEGELWVQARAGVRDIAEHMGSMVHTTIPPALREFLPHQPMVFAGTAAPSGHIWASVLMGEPGFLSAGESTLRIEGRRRAGDPLWENLRAGLPIGLLVADLATRRRARLNGAVTSILEDGFVIGLEQIYPNCSKYIQARQWSFDHEKWDAPDEAARTETTTTEPKITRGKILTARQQQMVRTADTFFIASAHPQHGADASHRGGRPGFVKVHDETHLRWPDYKGNSMFQTLGNIAVNPSAGLLFMDWEKDATLQLSGSATVLWNSEQTSQSTQAERIIEFELNEVIEISGGLPLRWKFLSHYPFNPPA